MSQQVISSQQQTSQLQRQQTVSGQQSESKLEKIKQNSKLSKQFSELPLYNIQGSAYDEVIPLGLLGVISGQISNGMQYFILKNKKPKNRAVCYLTIKVGSVLEDIHERGIAHLVEHLAFVATQNFCNHQVVQFLEEIGAQFGACQNAETGLESTTYKLTLPTDRQDGVLLSKALDILKEFAYHIRCADEDIDQERKVINEEWRMSRTAENRFFEDLYDLASKDSKFEDRLPIGDQNIIKKVKGDTVKKFYERWYHPKNMAIIVVGDFEDPFQVQMDVINKFDLTPLNDFNPIPEYKFTTHNQPILKLFTDKEFKQPRIVLMYKMPRYAANRPSVIKKDMYLENYMLNTLNNRFARLSQQPSSPYNAVQFQKEDFTKSMSALIVVIIPYNTKLLQSIESVLMEISRIRIHGLTNREIITCKSTIVNACKQYIAEKDNEDSESLADQYNSHYLQDLPVLQGDSLASVYKALIHKDFDHQELSEQAEFLKLENNCILQVAEYKSTVSKESILGILKKVQDLETRQKIEKWVDVQIPKTLIPEGQHISQGSIIDQIHFPETKITEFTLSNGMKVSYKSTDFMEYEIHMGGYANGGLSEFQDENELKVAQYAVSTAQYMGLLGFKNEDLIEILATIEASIDVSVGNFTRNIAGSVSVEDLEYLMQMVYLVFTAQVELDSLRLKRMKDSVKEILVAEERDPTYQYNKQAQKLVYGDVPQFRTVDLKDVESLDYQRCLQWYRALFCDPGQFTLVFVGRIREEEFKNLVLKYLAGITQVILEQGHPTFPKQALPSIKDVSRLCSRQPEGIVQERLKQVMMEDIGYINFTIPIRIQLPQRDFNQVYITKAKSKLQTVHNLADERFNALRDCNFQLMVVHQALENEITEQLRFKNQRLYSHSIDFGHSFIHTRTVDGLVQTNLSIGLTCDAKCINQIVGEVIMLIKKLQEQPLEQKKIETIVNLINIQFEDAEYEDLIWLADIIEYYKSESYEEIFNKNLDLCRKANLDLWYERQHNYSKPEVLQNAFKTYFDIYNNYVIVTLEPQKSLYTYISSIFKNKYAYYCCWFGPIIALGFLGTLTYKRLQSKN